MKEKIMLLLIILNLDLFLEEELQNMILQLKMDQTNFYVNQYLVLVMIRGYFKGVPSAFFFREPESEFWVFWGPKKKVSAFFLSSAFFLRWTWIWVFFYQTFLLIYFIFFRWREKIRFWGGNWGKNHMIFWVEKKSHLNF